MQAELRRFSHRADEEQDAGHGQRVELPAEKPDGVAGDVGRAGEDGVELQRAEDEEDGEDAEQEAEIADPVDDEGLDRGGIGAVAIVPEADQQIRAEADAFPAEEHLDEIVRRHQRQHEEGEEAEIGHEARDRLVVRHVADRIDVDGSRDDADHHHHDGAQRVEAQRPVDLQLADGEPGEQRDGAAMLEHGDVIEGRDAAQSGEAHRTGDDKLRAAIAHQAVEEPGDEGGEERQENGDDAHGGSALHQVDVGDFDGAAIAEIDDQYGKADRRLGGGDGQHEHGEDLADEIVQEGRESDEVDVDGEQDELDRHQDDDDVLAVEEDAEDAEGEEHGTDGEIVGEADFEHVRQTPFPISTLMISTEAARDRKTWALAFCRRTPTRARKVRTMAPIMAMSRTT